MLPVIYFYFIFFKPKTNIFIFQACILIVACYISNIEANSNLENNENTKNVEEIEPTPPNWPKLDPTHPKPRSKNPNNNEKAEEFEFVAKTYFPQTCTN